MASLAIFLVGYSYLSRQTSGATFLFPDSVEGLTLAAFAYGTFSYVRFLCDVLMEHWLLKAELQPKYDELSELIHMAWFKDRAVPKGTDVGTDRAYETVAGATPRVREVGIHSGVAREDVMLEAAIIDLAQHDLQRALLILRVARALGRVKLWSALLLPSLMMMAALGCIARWN
jgi:pimeloyl-ACP methyl ester carboxylesterase